MVIEALGKALRGASSEDAQPLTELELCYPGAFAVGFSAWTGQVRTDAHGSTTNAIATQSKASQERAAASGCPHWQLDLAESEPHLDAALARAAEQVAAIPNRPAPEVAVGRWPEDKRELWCSSVCLLASVWPELLAELRVTIRQLVVIEGNGIAGFAADFGAHGAAFINRKRLGDFQGIPGRIGHAEHITHEGVHVRMHAASVAEPFLVTPRDQAVLVKTPLRDDPRPLNGLFQQFVVVSRCRILFDRMLASEALHADEREPAQTRREQLAQDTARAAAVLSDHREALTDRGREVLDEAEVAA